MLTRGADTEPGQALDETPGTERPLPLPAIGIAIVGCAAAILSTGLPWLSAGFGQQPRVYRGTELPVLAGVVVVASTTALAGLARAQASHSKSAVDVAACASALTLAFTALLIVVLETVATMIPVGLLPVTIRRLGVGLSAGPGLWLAFASSGAALAALTIESPSDPWRAIRRAAKRSPSVAAGGLLLAACTALVAWLRYQPWMTGMAAGETLRFEAWATPWLGPLSLLALWTLVAACGASLTGRQTAAALLAASGGWLTTFVAALAIVAARTLAKVRLDDVLGHRLSGYTPSLGVATAAWIAFFVGLGAAASGAALLWRLHMTLGEA